MKKAGVSPAEMELVELVLRDDQLRALQYILSYTKEDLTSFERDLPSQPATRAIDELLDYFNFLRGA